MIAARELVLGSLGWGRSVAGWGRQLYPSQATARAEKLESEFPECAMFSLEAAKSLANLASGCPGWDDVWRTQGPLGVGAPVVVWGSQ